MATNEIDVAAILNNRRLDSFSWMLIVLSALSLIIDGYDISALSYAAPRMVQQWHVSRSIFGPVFFAGVVGQIPGSLFFGYLADRAGRRAAIITMQAVVGVFALLTAFVTNVTELTILRMVVGFCAGGGLPIVAALNIEWAPIKYRATTVMLCAMGISLGTAAAGQVAAWLIPVFGWPMEFWVGGAVPLLLCFLLVPLLPESVRFLVTKGRPAAQISRLLKRASPELDFGTDPHFILRGDSPPREAKSGGLANLQKLFAGRLIWATPLLWLAYMASSMSLYFLNYWTPMLAEYAGKTPHVAALSASLYGLGGILGSFVLMRFIDRFGARVVTFMPFCGIFAVAMLGTVSFPGSSFMFAMFAVGTVIEGGHRGLHSVAGMFYPSEYRGTALGWALGIARIGASAGALVGGYMIAAHLSVHSIFLLAALPSVVFASCMFGLGVFHRQLKREEDEALNAPLTEGLPLAALSSEYP